jgi:ubiquinone/menaquinone biosynthesis C-methylase UbiE
MTARRVGARRLILWAAALALMMAAVSGVRLRARADDAADVQRLVDALDVREGTIVAEIGAGDGDLSIAVARQVGRTGRVFTSELGGERVGRLRQAVEKAGAENITVVEGAATETRLPERCCEGIFMRDVYHHFTDPPAMNASLRAALKPCGRLALLDFAPNGQESPAPSGRAGSPHGVTRVTTRAELERAGFEVLRDEVTTGRHFLLVAQRPAPDRSASCPGSRVLSGHS